MNCSAYHEMISAYVDRELDDGGAVALFAHLTICEECRNTMTDSLALRESIHRSQRHDVPASLDKRVYGIPFGDRPPVLPAQHRTAFRLIRRTITIPAIAALLIVTLTVAGSVYVTSTFFPRHEIIEKQEKELVYIMELPQVEVKGQAVDGKHYR